MWSGGWAHGGNGDDEILQYSRDAWLDRGLNNETITMIGGNGDDELLSQDATSTVTMDGGRGTDTCSGGASLSHCEG